MLLIPLLHKSQLKWSQQNKKKRVGGVGRLSSALTDRQAYQATSLMQNFHKEPPAQSDRDRAGLRTWDVGPGSCRPWQVPRKACQATRRHFRSELLMRALRGEGSALLTSAAKINSERKLLCPPGNFSPAMLTPPEAHFLLIAGNQNPNPAKKKPKKPKNLQKYKLPHLPLR